MKITDNKGNLFKSTSREDLVLELYKSGWGKRSSSSLPSEADLQQYCLECTHRINHQYAINLTWSTTAEFVEELVNNKLILEVD
jgi:hypothetical protein